MFMHPYFGRLRSSFGISPPYATTIIASGAASVISCINAASIFSGWLIGSKSSLAAVFTGGGVSLFLFPGLSG